MAMTPAKMKHLDMVILERDARQVTTLLGRLGVLHLVEVKPDESPARVPASAAADMEKCRNLLNRLNVVQERMGLTQLPELKEEPHDPISAVEQEIVRVENRVLPLLNERSEVETESESIHDELARLDALGVFTVSLSRIVDSPFLHFAVGSMRASDLKRLNETRRANILILSEGTEGDRQRVIAVTSRKGRFALETLLKQHNFIREELGDAPKGAPAQVVAGLEKRLNEIRQAQARISRELRNAGSALAVTITQLQRRLQLENALLSAALNFGHTGSTCLIRGWLPAESLPVVTDRVLQQLDGRAVIQWREPQETGASPNDVPVMLRHGRFVRPFQLLVTGFGFPRYNELEPTLVVAISFLIMFGLMFGDVGHGALLAVIGLVMARKAKLGLYKDLGAVIAYAGASAVLGGFLYGSVFGMERLPALWLRPMEDVMRLLAIPLVIGILLISTGVWLNIVNNFRTKNYFHGVVDRFGVVGIIFYWGAIGLALRYAVLGSKSISTLQLLLFILLPLVVLFFRELLYNRIIHKGHGEGSVASLMHGGVEVMETVSSYLANTVSFARVGAFALAHAGLSLAVFELEKQVRDVPGGVLWSILILVLGNLLILLLEGLIVFVQCLRLEYYEFFGKFFGGEGKVYTPFRL